MRVRPSRLCTRPFGLVLLTVLAGCMSRPQMTRDEYLAMTTRTFPGLSVEEVARVVEASLNFSLPGQFAYTHSEGGMQAVNTNPFGASAWTVQLLQTPAGARAQVALSAPGAAGPVPVFGGGGMVAVGLAPTGMVPVTGTASYELFWSRVEYMAGTRKDWMTCKDANERLLVGVMWGPIFALCGSRLMDPVPTAPLIGTSSPKSLSTVPTARSD